MKKGFTLIEILTVITLIAVISLIAFPKITELFNKKQAEASEEEKQVLYMAANEYIESNAYMFKTGQEYYCITIEDLVNDGKLIEPVIDVATGNELSFDINIEVTFENNQPNFSYNTSRCG